MGKFFKPQYLCITSGLFVIPLCIYLLKLNKNKDESFLAIILLLCFIFSQIFWYKPINGSCIHKIDALITRITIVLFAIYTIFYKKLSKQNLVFYFLLGILALCAFYRSDFFSTKEWCSDGHLLNHGLLHITGLFAFLYVFV